MRYETKDTLLNTGLEMISGQSTGFESDSSWNLDKISPEKIGEQAAFLAHQGQNGRDIKTGSYEVVLSPIALSELLEAAIVPALSGRNVHTGRSFFTDKIGQMVADSTISILDDPFDSRGLSNCNWDGEGMPVRENIFIQNGELSSFAYDLKTAYRYNQKPTASAVRSGQSGAPSIGHHNLILKGETDSILEDNVIYVQNLIGAHTANPMSGDFSVELSSPFFADNGELQEPIKSGMISGNIFELLNHINGCSMDTRTLGSMILPSVRFSGLSVIGRG
jgi:PmbA protein